MQFLRKAYNWKMTFLYRPTCKMPDLISASMKLCSWNIDNKQTLVLFHCCIFVLNASRVLEKSCASFISAIFFDHLYFTNNGSTNSTKQPK